MNKNIIGLFRHCFPCVLLDVVISFEVVWHIWYVSGTRHFILFETFSFQSYKFSVGGSKYISHQRYIQFFLLENMSFITINICKRAQTFPFILYLYWNMREKKKENERDEKKINDIRWKMLWQDMSDMRHKLVW